VTGVSKSVANHDRTTRYSAGEQRADEVKRWWGGRDSNPRPEDYEDFWPKRYAFERGERWRSERGAPNPLLLKGAHNKIS
jgi:hypothetical protein